MGKEWKLPKNIRQIGEIQEREKICIEDYVMTYIRKKEPQEEKGYLGILLGEQQKTEGKIYLFVRGILEVPPEEDPQKLKKKLESDRALYFPKWEVQGSCVIGTYPTKRLELLNTLLPAAGQLIYHLQEQEEVLYWKTNGKYECIRGYFVFYEQNRNMQSYLAEVFGETSVEKEGTPDRAIRSFRKKVKEKGEVRTQSFLRLASSFFVLTVLIIGVITVNHLGKQQSSQSAASDSIRLAGSAQGGTVQAGQSSSVYLQENTSDKTDGDTADVQENSVFGTTGGEVAVASVFYVEDSVSTKEEDAAEAETEQSLAVSSDAVQDTAKESSGTDLTAQADAGSSEESWLTGSDAFWEETFEDEADGSADAGGVDEESRNAGSTNVSGTDSSDEAEEGTAAEETDTEETQESSAQSGAVETSRQIQASYVVRSGDTLADICQKYYGTLNRLEEICEVNQISDPNLILPGDKIILP